MTNYSILSFIDPKATDIPTYSQAGFFFNEWAHLRQQHVGAIRLLTALNHQTQLTDARCALFIQPNYAVSPQAAPFGSIEFADDLPDTVLSTLIDSMEADTHFTAGSSLRLINYPHCYAPIQAYRLTKHLLMKGYKRVVSNQNSYVPISREPFEATLHSSKRRQLVRSRRAGLHVVNNPALTNKQIVDFVVNSRRNQGYTLTIPADRLTYLLTHFPSQFQVFAVMAGVDIAALTITVRVRNDILYNFIPADNPAYRSFSPMVAMTAGLYAYCQTHSIRILDLGVSLDADRQPKPGLIQFKRQLGALESPKLTFEKRW